MWGTQGEYMVRPDISRLFSGKLSALGSHTSDAPVRNALEVIVAGIPGLLLTPLQVLGAVVGALDKAEAVAPSGVVALVPAEPEVEAVGCSELPFLRLRDCVPFLDGLACVAVSGGGAMIDWIC